MQAQEVTLGRRGFRVSRVFVVILDRKVIQGVIIIIAVTLTISRSRKTISK